MRVNDEIQEIIDSALAEGHPVVTSWVVQELVQRHSDVSGDDADWHLVHSRQHLGKLVRDRLRPKANGKEDEVDQQLVLPGYRFVQAHYSLERDGEPTIVPTAVASDLELEAKAEHLTKMSATCREHAKELRKYIADRRAQSNSGSR